MKTEADLRPHARRGLAEAYDHAARRSRCSRQDFTSGFVAALEWIRSTSSFVADPPARPPEREP